MSYGYTGKQIIHPNQINVCQDAYLPTPDRIKWAHMLLEMYEKIGASDNGIFVYDGKMIDAPTIKQAQNIVTLIKHIKSFK